uniref:Uncharacterized protein n=1 Tax=Panagrolaimus sp. JU765 TaxID=591449 RepID=A0AC34REG9_9BILA
MLTKMNFINSQRLPRHFRAYHNYYSRLEDKNFPCNNAGKEYIEWAMYKGRHMHYSVYMDTTEDLNAYLFFNSNGDICEYHIPIDQLKQSDINDDEPHYPALIHNYKRFKGLRFDAPEGYKYVTPLMAVDAAARTLNFMVISLINPSDLKLIYYRFTSVYKNEPLEWKKFDMTPHFLPAFRNAKFVEEDYNHRFLVNWTHNDPKNCQLEPLGGLFSFECMHSYGVPYHGHVLWGFQSMSDIKESCNDDRLIMGLERHHCDFQIKSKIPRPSTTAPPSNNSIPQPAKRTLKYCDYFYSNIIGLSAVGVFNIILLIIFGILICIERKGARRKKIAEQRADHETTIDGKSTKFTTNQDLTVMPSKNKKKIKKESKKSQPKTKPKKGKNRYE